MVPPVNLIFLWQMEENIVCGNRVLSPSASYWPSVCVCVCVISIWFYAVDISGVMQRLVKRFCKTLRVQCEIHYGPVI